VHLGLLNTISYSTCNSRNVLFVRVPFLFQKSAFHELSFASTECKADPYAVHPSAENPMSGMRTISAIKQTQGLGLRIRNPALFNGGGRGDHGSVPSEERPDSSGYLSNRRGSVCMVCNSVVKPSISSLSAALRMLKMTRVERIP
jgi:hypothetical protein